MNKLASFRISVEFTRRCISTSSALASRKNFRKFYIPSEVRGTRQFRERQLSDNPNTNFPLEKYGARDTTIRDDNGHLVEIPEMIPEMIVPDLKDFDLKPYVSYRATEFTQTEFTAEDLFNAVYSNKIVEDWNKKQLNEDGSPKNPNEVESLGPEEAFIRARKTGSDIFEGKPRNGVYYYINSEMFKEDEEFEKQRAEKEKVNTEARLKEAAIKEARLKEAELKEVKQAI